MATLSKNDTAHLLIITYLKVQGRTKYVDERSTTTQVKIYSW